MWNLFSDVNLSVMPIYTGIHIDDRFNGDWCNFNFKMFMRGRIAVATAVFALLTVRAIILTRVVSHLARSDTPNVT